MKRILMLLITASLAYSCNATKEAKPTTNSLSKAIENKLQEVWVLDEMNGKKVTESDFEQQLPKVEINTSAESFTGNSGCNAIKGFLFSKEKGELQFLNVSSETKKCPAAKKEDEFLRLLKTTTNYTRKSEKLSLFNQFGPTLVFKKL
ncbi:META domain-containing protein [Flavobacterium flavipigmentatum]|uniref:META domain-containing protein n=2 Tax=Flavobacterium flavipigmentatum TaxID=2893884 RepID=A0ABU4R328_9FLAO|nr:META domain-containing protein [Flavobacterium sp. F-70]MDX6183423.1 META domain-containing protein [Flavobacterium sp. Fl-33]UFH38525.1 META domain-containing protein [Flavobacterium sp. F-70]